MFGATDLVISSIERITWYELALIARVTELICAICWFELSTA